jgi:hypothetical protein
MNRTLMSAAVAVAFLLAALPLQPTHAASSRACDAWARDYARNASRQGQVVRRGLFGGLLGVGIGAATGGGAAGAAIGGGVGALSGAHARQRTADKIYWAAYRDCMAGRVR